MCKAWRRWWPRVPDCVTVPRPDHRAQMTATMCPACAKRWLAGRSLWHPWCAVELRHGFDVYFERLRDRPQT